MNGLFFNLLLSNLQYLLYFISYFCLLQRLLKGNIDFERIKQFGNWRVHTKVFLFLNLFISMLEYLFIFLFHVFKLRSEGL